MRRAQDETNVGCEEMIKYVLKRIGIAVLTVLLVATITFFLMNAVPGNPWLSEKSPSDAVIEAHNTPPQSHLLFNKLPVLCDLSDKLLVYRLGYLVILYIE